MEGKRLTHVGPDSTFCVTRTIEIMTVTFIRYEDKLMIIKQSFSWLIFLCIIGGLYGLF